MLNNDMLITSIHKCINIEEVSQCVDVLMSHNL